MSAKKIRVLVIDDSALMRQLIREILESDPCIEVIGTAGDPYAAREKILALKPDVLTLDVEMPKMDGIETIRSLRKINTKAHILVVSALADKATAIQALKEGAQGFLYKPFKETELIEAIEEILGGQ